MNLEETGKLLALAALVDNRKLTAPAAQMWHRIIGHLDYQTAVAAMEDHFANSKDYLMPVHIIEGAQRVRDNQPPDRLLALESPPVDPQAGLREYVASQGIAWDEFQALRETGLDMFTAIEKLGGDQ